MERDIRAIPGNPVDDAVSKLYRSDKILYNEDAVAELRKSLNTEELTSKAYNMYNEKLHKIQKKAEEFKRKLFVKYPEITPSEFYRKAKKYAVKYNFSDAELDMFIKFVKGQIGVSGVKGEYKYDVTPMGRTLGFKPDIYSSHLSYDKSNKEEDEALKIIYNIKKENETLSNMVKLQALTYQDCDLRAFMGKFDETRNNKYQYIHPVIAALFIPKIKVLEHRFIYANIADLVIRRNESLPIKDVATKNLFYDLAMDPSQAMDSSRRIKPIVDLQLRASLQVILWRVITEIREGKYYGNNAKLLEDTINNSVVSVYDAPDLLFSRDAGNILRRLLNAFSFRPTRVEISKIMPSNANNLSDVWSQIHLDSVYPHLVTETEKKYVNIPMVNVRLPVNIVNGQLEHNALSPIKLSVNTAPTQWFNSNSSQLFGKLYSQNIVSTNGVIFFYINRQYNTVNTANYHNGQFVMTELPPTFEGVSRCNDTPVDFDMNISCGGKIYTLRSVVCNEVIDIVGDHKVIVGSSAIIIKNGGSIIPNNRFLYYTPSNVGMDATGEERKNAFGYIPENGVGAYTFKNLASTQGTIFMYANNEN